jgi:hypothetical protein
VAGGLETVVERSATGEAVAWFPAVLHQLCPHPTAPTWAGAAGNHVFLFTLEGPAVVEAAR